MTSAEPVTVENFVRAETDRMFDFVLKDTGAINAWAHNRVPTPLDHQPVIRQNRDTLYSAAVVDVSKGATLTVPESGDRYVSAMVISQDHFVPFIIHAAGDHALSRENCGTDYVTIAVRTLVNPDDAADVEAVNALQDRFAIQANSAVPFTHPAYDEESFNDTRGHLLALSKGLPDFRNAFGKEGEVDPMRHLLGSASAWGGFPEHEAIYLNVEPKLPVGHYELTVRDVPVDAFWSITVYNPAGYMSQNDRGVVSVNSVTAAPNADGSVTVRFGDGDEPNAIPTPEGWNYMVRLYRPRREAQSREWIFPSITA